MKGPGGPSPQPSRSETHTLSVLPGSSPRFSACEPHHEKQAQEGQEEINPQVGGAPPSVRTQTPHRLQKGTRERTRQGEIRAGTWEHRDLERPGWRRPAGCSGGVLSKLRAKLRVSPAPLPSPWPPVIKAPRAVQTEHPCSPFIFP